MVFKNRASPLHLLSTPILALATQRISLQRYDAVGMDAKRVSQPQGISVLHELVDVALEIIEKLSGHVSVMVVPKLRVGGDSGFSPFGIGGMGPCIMALPCLMPGVFRGLPARARYNLIPENLAILQLFL